MLKMAYCDKIAFECNKALGSIAGNDPDGIVQEVKSVQWDLHPEGGYFLSPKKMFTVYDSNGKAYSVTVEEQPVLDKEIG
jgi:hypothetical protein